MCEWTWTPVIPAVHWGTVLTGGVNDRYGGDRINVSGTGWLIIRYLRILCRSLNRPRSFCRGITAGWKRKRKWKERRISSVGLVESTSHILGAGASAAPCWKLMSTEYIGVNEMTYEEALSQSS